MHIHYYYYYSTIYILIVISLNNRHVHNSPYCAMFAFINETNTPRLTQLSELYRV